MANIIITGVNLNHGDSVLLVAPEYLTDSDLQALKNEMESRCPGVKFVFLSGDFQLIGSYSDAVKVIEV